MMAEEGVAGGSRSAGRGPAFLVPDQLERSRLRRRMLVGNWKMNQPADVSEYLQQISSRAATLSSISVAIAPPATLLAQISRSRDILAAGQDCHKSASGPFTGAVSAALLRHAGASLVLIGHSERRAEGDTDQTVRSKLERAWAAGLTPILCVGETMADVQRGLVGSRVAAQVLAGVPEDEPSAPLIVAYEPVWAIGTGRTPTQEEVGAAAAAIRQALRKRISIRAEQTTILYGGSVTPTSVLALCGVSDIDGFLVGSASLSASDIVSIMEAIAS